LQERMKKPACLQAANRCMDFRGTESQLDSKHRHRRTLRSGDAELEYDDDILRLQAFHAHNDTFFIRDSRIKNAKLGWFDAGEVRKSAGGIAARRPTRGEARPG